MRIKPGHWLCRIADGAEFIAVSVFHQNCADAVGAQQRGHFAVQHPFAFKFAADLRALKVNVAAARVVAVPAPVAGRFAKVLDFQHLAAHGAGAAVFAGNGEHGNQAARGEGRPAVEDARAPLKRGIYQHQAGVKTAVSPARIVPSRSTAA